MEIRPNKSIADGFEWRCRAKYQPRPKASYQQCDTRRSIRHGTFFGKVEGFGGGSNLSMFQLVLGLTEGLTEKENSTEILEGGKLTIWKRNRCGKSAPQECGVRRMNSKNPFANLWKSPRPSFLPSGNEPVENRDFIEFIMRNGELFQQLGAFNFNVGIMEATALERNPLAVFKLLPTIKKTVVTSPVVMNILHWKLLRKYEEFVDEIPGNNIGKFGDHKLAGTGKRAFRQRNAEYLEKLTAVGHKTHSVLQRELFLRALAIKNAGLRAIAEEMPDFIAEYKNASLFYVNTQLMLEYDFVEQKVRKEEKRTFVEGEGPMLRFMGGIGVPNEREVMAEHLEEETSKILNSGKKVVLVSFGSVVDMGFYEDPKNPSQVEFDANERAKLFVHIFEQFPDVQFIMRYGHANRELGARQPFENVLGGKNVWGKGWLEQKAIMAENDKSGHTKLHAFISHCGQNSVNESVNFGIPLICLPFFGDQINNSEALASRGLAKVIDIDANLEEMGRQLKMALTEILHNPEYFQKMAKLQREFRAADWPELISQDLAQLRKSLVDTEICGQTRRADMQKFTFISQSIKEGDGASREAHLLVADAMVGKDGTSKVFSGYLGTSTELFDPKKCVGVKFTPLTQKTNCENSFKVIRELEKRLPNDQRKHLIGTHYIGTTASHYIAVMDLAEGDYFYKYKAQNFDANEEGMERLKMEIQSLAKPLEEMHKVGMHLDAKRKNFVYVRNPENGERLLKLIDFDSTVLLPELKNENGENAAEMPNENENGQLENEQNGHRQLLNMEMEPQALWRIRPDTNAAPEYANARQLISTKTDIYSLGMVMFELLMFQPKHGISQPEYEGGKCKIRGRISDIYRGFKWVNVNQNMEKDAPKWEPLPLDYESPEWLIEYSDALLHILELRKNHPPIFMLAANILQKQPSLRASAGGILEYLGSNFDCKLSVPSSQNGEMFLFDKITAPKLTQLIERAKMHQNEENKENHLLNLLEQMLAEGTAKMAQFLGKIKHEKMQMVLCEH